MKKTFAGIPEAFADYANSKIVLLPVMYDGTSTWGKGADQALEAFLDAAANMELYDIMTDSEVYRKGIFLAESLEGFPSAEEMVATVSQEVKKHIQAGKFVSLLGGEHSISIGSLQSHKEAYDDLLVVQFDAHADLRDQYEGTPYNHACAMHEISRTNTLYQIGIRSMDISEKAFMDKDKVYFMHDIYHHRAWIKELAERCSGKDVYITIDLDAFDIGLMPSTGTPEPGGLGYFEVIDSIQAISKSANIIGADIVELAPSKNNKAPNFLAAKLYYQMLSFIFKHQ